VLKRRQIMAGSTGMFYSCSKVYINQLNVEISNYLWDRLYWKLFFKMSGLPTGNGLL
jgi:hypothetical protein